MSRTVPNSDDHPAYKRYLQAYQAQRGFKAALLLCGALTAAGSWFAAKSDAENRGTDFTVVLFGVSVLGVMAAHAARDYQRYKKQATVRERLKFQGLEQQLVGGSLAMVGLIQYALGGAAVGAFLGGLEVAAQSDGNSSSVNGMSALFLAGIGLSWAAYKVYQKPLPPTLEELVVAVEPAGEEPPATDDAAAMSLLAGGDASAVVDMRALPNDQREGVASPKAADGKAAADSSVPPPQSEPAQPTRLGMT